MRPLGSQSYRPIIAHFVPNHHLARDPLQLSQGPLRVLGPHFGNHWCSCRALTARSELWPIRAALYATASKKKYTPF